MIGTGISVGECAALYAMVAGSETELVLRTDRHGRIVHASPAFARLGLACPDDLPGRHLLDLLHPDCAEIVIAQHAAALRGMGASEWIEVPARTATGGQLWLEVRFGPLPGGAGALALLRSIAERRALEDRLFVAAMTDPLTRLSNRAAFTGMLGHLIEHGAAGHVALFDLDHFRTLNLRHGHSGGDRVLVAFAGLLRALLRETDIVSRVGGGSFGVLLPDASANAAQRACQRVVLALAEMAADGAPGEPRISASAGIVPFGAHADATLRAAELALITAKSRGRARVEFAPRGCPRDALSRRAGP